MANDREPWHLDKKVPLALIATILLQTFLAGFAWSELRSSLADQERRIVRMETDAALRQRESVALAERLARIEQTLTAVDRTLARLERVLERRPQNTD